MDEIRSWWQVPSIAHFCSLFRSAFSLTDFEIEDLEDALMISGGEEDSRFLADLHARLLRGLFSKKADINADNFEPYLSEVLKVRWVDDLKRKNPLETARYRNLSTREKVEILHGLCDWRLDVDDVPDHLKGMEADSLRVEPLGRDAENNVYWYFYGTRLYKEYVERPENNSKEKMRKQKAKKRKKKKGKQKKKGKKKKRSESDSDSDSSSASETLSESEEDEPAEEDDGEQEQEEKECRCDEEPKRTWSLVCSTKEEWENLAEMFSSSKQKDEKLLHQTLTVDFLAEIARMLDVKDKAFRKKMLVEMAPRRSSDRIAIKAQQKEEEDKLAEIERQQQKERMAEIKKQEAEAREKERQIQAEKRQRERAERARLREERQWLIANGGDVPEEPILSLEKNGHSDETKTGDEENKLDELDKAFEGDVDMYTGMYKVLDSLKSHEDGWPFLEPVDESYAPQYFDIVTNPMDLSTIEKKIDEKEYKGLKEFISDVKLMFNNCLEYNGEESSYTQMARTLENVFERQMKKHFPDDDNQSSDEDFEEELTETELRKLNKKKANDVNGANDFDDDVQAADIYRSSQKNHMTDHRADLNMIAHHFGMNPMSNGVARRLPGQMAFPRQRMPYMGQVQPFYAPQMYPGHPAFTRFNMNDMARSVAPMFSPMMGMAPPRMAMSPRTPGQLSGQDMQTAATRGATPVATKGESSTSMWTDNRMQDMRGIGHAYPRRPMSSPNGPWQAGGVVPDPRQMVGGWRPPGPTRANGTSLEQNEPFGKGNAGPSQSDRYPIAINERATALGNRPDNDSGKTSSDLPTEVKRSGGPQPSEDDLRFPFITPQQRRSNETRHDAMTASRRLDNKTDNPPSRTFQPATSDERVTSPVGANAPRGKSPLGMQEQDQGKVFTDLTSVKPGQTRPGEKRGNPYSVSSIMGNDEQRTKRSDDERLKFSTLLQEMSQSRKSEPPGIPRAGEPSPGVNKVAQFMDLNTTRNQLPPAFIRQPKSIDHRPAVPNPGEPQQPQSLFGSYSKHAPTSHSPLNPSAVGSPSPFMDMRTRMDPAHLVSREGHAFDPRTLYPSYPSHGELQRHQMLMLQQQQQQMMHMGSMVSAGMPGGVPQEYAYLAQRPMYDAMLGRYKNGDKPATLDELTAKKSRVS